MNDNRPTSAPETHTCAPRVPSLRFPGFDAPWEEKRLGDVLNIKYGRDHQSLPSGKIPVYGTGGIIRFVDEKLNEGVSILIGRKGTIDAPMFVTGKFWVVDTMFYSDIKPEFIPFFAYLLTCKVQWLKYAEATGVPSLTKTTIEKIPLNVSNEKPEQQKIADFLGAVDRWLAGLRARQDALARYKRGVMQQIFSQQIRFTRDNGTPFPDWKEKRLGDVANKTRSTLTLSDLTIAPNDSKNKFPVYGADGLVGYSNAFQNEFIFFGIVKDGAGIGRVFPCPPKSSVLGTIDAIYGAKENLTRFVYYLFEITKFQRFIVGSGIPHIYFKEYATLTVNVPSPEEQQKITDFLGALDRRIDATTRQITTAKAFKHGLLQQMFV